MVARRILCVAEKNSIAKAVSEHLGGSFRTSNISGTNYVKNYTFDYRFAPPWGHCNVTFTAVAGHIISTDFTGQYSSWQGCDPGALFDAPILKSVENKNKPIADNIKQLARHASGLFIWTDCDREGENIGSEIRDLAVQVNPRLEIKRAHFSNIERAHVVQAAQNPVALDDRQANAVDARIELDLRTGAAFTRALTLQLRPMIQQVEPDLKLISYGSCQFPTLGFVVDRYFRVKNFVSEPFWSIRVSHRQADDKTEKSDLDANSAINVNFTWARGHLFDRMAVVVLYERCLAAKTAVVTKMQTRPTSKWKPLPLTTVELQKMGATYLRMNSHRVMQIAEELYTKGFISYPRTETDQFDTGIDLRALVQNQTNSQQWGQFATSLLNGGFHQPRMGRNNDKAHPPIHPVTFVAPSALNAEQSRVYEFIARRFLACCSEDAKGELTQLEIELGSETFRASGLVVKQRNFLEVYPYQKWDSSQQLPDFRVGERFVPTEAKMNEGKTSPPGYLTEPELIALMDANGIGTDATMAEHIAKIKDRQYVIARSRGGGGGGGGASGSSVDTTETDAAPSRGRGRGRGRGGRRQQGDTSARASSGSTRGVEEFIPTNLGVALIEGYENLQFETSLSKPFLRKEMELQMKAICDGSRTRQEVVQSSLDQYRVAYARTKEQIGVLKAAVRKYIIEPQDQT